MQTVMIANQQFKDINPFMPWEQFYNNSKNTKEKTISIPIALTRLMSGFYKLNTTGCSKGNRGPSEGGGIVRDKYGHIKIASGAALDILTNNMVEIQYKLVYNMALRSEGVHESSLPHPRTEPRAAKLLLYVGLHTTELGSHQTDYVGPIANSSDVTRVVQFMRLNPLILIGSKVKEDSQGFIDEIKKIFKVKDEKKKQVEMGKSQNSKNKYAEQGSTLSYVTPYGVVNFGFCPENILYPFCIYSDGMQESLSVEAVTIRESMLLDDQPPQPVDPENESVSLVEFQETFQVLAQVVTYFQGNCQAAAPLQQDGNSAIARIRSFMKMNLPEFFGFFPLDMRKAKVKELMNLRKGSITVKEYCLKFSQLAKYAPDLIADPRASMSKFVTGVSGLRQIRLKRESVNTRAKIGSRDLTQSGSQGGSSSHNGWIFLVPSLSSASVPTFGGVRSEEAPSSKAQSSTSGVRTHPRYKECGRCHQGVCRVGRYVCFGCGEAGHKLRECRVMTQEG
ncbi:hypothetical protein FXO38_10115 [Capsicum annuum]|nr:hypothetical protein FXO38_10115 [Capsicum annuum]